MPHVLIGSVASLFILINAWFAIMPGYRIAPLFLIPLVWAGYLLRRKLHLSAVGYALFAAAVLLHDLGAYGYYQNSPTPPVSFDMYVHFYFALAGTVVLHRALAHHLSWRGWQLALATVLFIMGVGAIHEIMEYSTYLVLGEERGMLKPTTSYRFDNERDLMCNLAGCLVAIGFITIGRVFSPKHRRQPG